ncbi:hypothetical protein [Haloferula sp. A504]|uniref:hypothetical protein n=1 Tax=Haloferula sp. A504 TaxID=3373601 RepID=UPI0031CAD27D|nr:hypothetical protein [Verrucomicrobiaceae bacterium E54]
MRAIALDPEAAPPSTLTIRTRKGFQTIPTILNRPSPVLPVRAGKLRVFANGEAGPDEEPELFGEFAIPGTSGHYDIFLNRDPKRKDWEKAQAIILPASSTAFPEGSFRLVNLCGIPVMVRVGKETLQLAARKARLHRAGPGTDGRMLTLQALYQAGDGSARLFLRTGIKASSRDRTNIIFYPGRDPKKPCKATWFTQIPPSPLNEDEDETS